MSVLNDYCLSIADGDHQAPPKSHDGIPFITISCMNPDGGQLDFSSAANVPEEYYDSLPGYRKAREGDVLLSVVGSLGIPYLVKSDDRFVFQRHIAILRPGKNILPEYLYYLLKSPDVFHYIDSVAQGAAQRTLTLTQLRSMEVSVPPIEEQRCIVEKLKPYDDLIENNRRQIKLLEEAARRLYKEWFVDLKFPGHESTPIVNGLPEGWKSTHLSNLVTFLNGYAFKSNQFVEDGKFKIATIKNVQDGYFEPNPASSIREIPTNMPAHCVLAKGDILLSLTGNIGRICMVTNDNFLLNQRVAKLVSRYRCYTYCLFKDSVFSAELKNLANGAAQKNLSPNKAGLLNITKPSDKLLSAFESLSLPYFSQINYLYFQITVAREARDRLLPKLMSGEIEV